MSDIRYSVVIPVYRNRDSIPDLIKRLISLRHNQSGSLEAVFVVDGSPDDSLDVLRTALADAPLPTQLISLSRNFGSMSAIRAGLKLVRGKYIGVMAADLQEPPEVLEAFFDSLEAGECDIALGQRVGRQDPAVSSLMAKAYWSVYRRLINRDIPAGGIDIFGCTSQIAQLISEFPETHTSLVGLIYWVGYRRKCFPYVRQARQHGKSAWTFGRKLRYFFDSIYAFTDLPIILLQAIGLVGVIGSSLLGLVIFAGWLMGQVHSPGYTPLMIVLLASASAILLGLGVVGSYVARGYENSKGRPVSLIASHEFFGRQD